MMNEDPRSTGPEHLPPREGLGLDRVTRVLAEDAAAERNHPPVDADRFVRRLRARLLPEAPPSRLGSVPWLRLAATAAAIPVALAAWLLLSQPASEPGDGSVEIALLEDLDLLLLLEELTPEEILELDPDLIGLYQHVEVIEELPLQVLGGSDS